MAYLCLVRHGESEGNINKRFSGHTDHALTNTGVDQAEICGLRLSKIHFDVMYSSNLSRAVATAQLIKNYNLSGISDWRRTDLLQERAYGIVENLSRENIIERYSDDVISSWHTSINRAPPGGESYINVLSRCTSFYNSELLSQITENNILIVAHAGVIKCLMSVIEDRKLIETIKVPIKNAEPIIYEF